MGPGFTDDAGIWAFDVDGAGLIALGVQPTDSIFTPGRITLRLVYPAGAPIEAFQVEYTVWVNNASGRANSLNLMASPDDVSYVQIGSDFVSGEAYDELGWISTDREHVITPASPIEAGDRFYLAWDGADVSGTGSRDEFGIEGITIRLLDVCGNGLVERGEACDDGLDNSNAGACLTSCAAASCGDGFVREDLEACDDGNVNDGDGCASDCTLENDGTETDASTTGDDTPGTDESSDTGTSQGTGSAATTAPSTTVSTTGPTSGGDTDTDPEPAGDDEGGGGCSCGSSGGAAPLSCFVLVALLRRRR